MMSHLDSVSTSCKGAMLELHFQGEAAVTQLADYSAPPVVEVSLGFQFESLARYNSILAADFWNRIRGAFPLVEEQPPLDPAFETFGSNDGSIPQSRIEFVSGAIQPRFFFVEESNMRLLQFQRDRLHLNWRRTEAGQVYPRYPALREAFEEA